MWFFRKNYNYNFRQKPKQSQCSVNTVRGSQCQYPCQPGKTNLESRKDRPKCDAKLTPCKEDMPEFVKVDIYIPKFVKLWSGVKIRSEGYDFLKDVYRHFNEPPCKEDIPEFVTCYQCGVKVDTSMPKFIILILLITIVKLRSGVKIGSEGYDSSKMYTDISTNRFAPRIVWRISFTFGKSVWGFPTVLGSVLSNT